MPCEPIKLLKFISSFHIGGTEGQVLNLARGLDPGLFDLSFGCLRREGDLLWEIEQHWKAEEYSAPRFLHPRAWLHQWRLARYLRVNRVQIVHAYGFYGNLFAVPAARLAGTPVIVASIRDRGDYLSRRQRVAHRFACGVATRILANSEAVRQKLIEEGYDPNKITVIRNGLILSKFRERNGRVVLRNEFGVPEGAPVVAVVSRLSQLKGIDDFLNAARTIAQRVPSVRFLIVGDGECREDLERSATQLGLARRIVFTGFRRDIPELLSEVHVSVLPSLSEGLSNTLLESMAAGVPVVATNVGGNPEAVEHGATGLLVAPRDPASLAQAVCTLLQDRDLASRLGKMGKQRVARLFSMDQMVRETQSLYLALLNPATCRQGATA